MRLGRIREEDVRNASNEKRREDKMLLLRSATWLLLLLYHIVSKSKIENGLVPWLGDLQACNLAGNERVFDLRHSYVSTSTYLYNLLAQ